MNRVERKKALSPFGLPPTEQDLPVKGGECNCWPEREEKEMNRKRKGKKKNYKRKERKKGRGKIDNEQFIL